MDAAGTKNPRFTGVSGLPRSPLEDILVEPAGIEPASASPLLMALHMLGFRQLI